MKGVILAAGRGTRLQPLTYSIPKEMIHVRGKPLIHHAVELLKMGGVKNIVVIVGNKKGAIFDYLRDGKWIDVDISYRFQEIPSGVATGIYTAKPLINGTFVLTFGDEIIEPKDSLIKNLLRKHKERNSYCTLGLSPVDDPKRYGIVKIGDDGKIIEMIEKPQTDEELERVKTNGEYLGINGVYVFESKIFEFIEKTPKGAKDEYQITDSIKLMIQAGLPCYAVIHDGIYRDVGTFDALLNIERELLNID
jgi:dTDP-glucose pyrophosphorylase